MGRLCLLPTGTHLDRWIQRETVKALWLKAWAVGSHLPHPVLTPLVTFGKLPNSCELHFPHLYQVDTKPTSRR